ncbi:transglycosylase SLT domain-containing protein [Streptomyces sp. TRM 70351]|uniref:transglycosylase SLT domain-containing protein n=1 Tax=Streptomyces sp. TRM 70351 TaxID=3116552 RepID=UPI002E7AF6E7|nr:transglycosylase SLT domain-containing protein [Streptomyces sp. TRM 70351]MEE1928734.1 transglycosylase SLT domain-containing protein [Streptomyces sp. TRM 70351]
MPNRTPETKPESKISMHLRQIPASLRNELPGYLRELQDNVRAVPGQLRELPAQLREVPDHLREVPNHLRELPDHLREVPGHARAVARDPRRSAIAVTAAAGTVAVGLALIPASGSADESRTIADGPAGVLLAQGVHGQVEPIEGQQEAAADRAAEAREAAEAKAERERETQAAADRSSKREAAPATQQTYPDNLDGWIREAMAIMDQHGIPGSYDRIKWNIMRESSGNPNAINDWDINARNGVPSIGLLQIIKPTFDAYHVEGTPHSQWDPVANIVASCNYAADRYGSIDHVWSAY